MTEQQAEEMLASLKRIEMVLQVIANSTQDAIPFGQRHGPTVRFFPALFTPQGAQEIGPAGTSE